MITYISHPVTTSLVATTPLTSGFNTYTSNTVTSTTGVTIFDPNPPIPSITTGKNNLGSLNAVAFFGFNQFELSAMVTVDI